MTVSGDFRVAGALAVQNALKQGAEVTNLNRIADGIVHLRVRAFATNGFLVAANPAAIQGTNGMFPFTTNAASRLSYTNVWDTSIYGSALDREQSACYFMNEAVPAYVEIEIGILEPQVLRRYRNVDYTAYP
jgi:hypothetical protein